MPLELRTVSTKQETVFIPPTGVATVYRVTFMVGDNGPFSLDFTPADFTPGNVRAKQEEIARTVRELAGP